MIAAEYEAASRGGPLARNDTTMTSSNIEQLASALLAVRREQRPCDPAPFTNALRGADEAYAVQELVARALAPQQQGVARCWKTGGRGRDGLFPHAPLPAAGVWSSPASAGTWHFNLCQIEAEVALRLGRAVTPAQAAAMSYEEVLPLFDGMTVSIEVVDSRWRQDAEIAPLLKLADLQSHGALVLGDWVPFGQRDWARQTCSVTIGNQPVVSRRGTHPMGDPAAPIADWLRHATREGGTVAPGTVVTTGSWCGMLPAVAGDLVLARFDGIGEATLQL